MPGFFEACSFLLSGYRVVVRLRKRKFLDSHDGVLDNRIVRYFVSVAASMKRSYVELNVQGND